MPSWWNFLSPQKRLLATFCLFLLLTEYLWYCFVLKGYPLVHTSLEFTQLDYPTDFLSVFCLVFPIQGFLSKSLWM